LEKNNKIYVAGHLGMVGSAIVRALKHKGYGNIIGKRFDDLDLMDQKAVDGYFSANRPEYVFLAAAKVGGILANNIYRAQFLYENLTIQNNIIHSAHKYGVKKLLFLGSSCIYPRNCEQPMKEEYLLTGELEPTNEPYAIAKIAGIKMCESYDRQYGSNFISVMPTNLYGPNDNYNLETSHVLPALIRKMHLGKCLQTNDWAALRRDLDKRPIEGTNGSSTETDILFKLGKYGIKIDANATANRHPVTITFWGTGQAFREFMHVEDMADATVFIMEKVDATDLEKMFASNTTRSAIPYFLNIGTGKEDTIHDVAYLIKDIIGFSGELAWDPSKPDGTPRKLLDISRLHNAGFTHQYGLKEGITKVYHEYRSEAI
jgi:GDP-L-fucose synthase